MIKKINIFKHKSKNSFLYTSIFISLFWLKEINYLFYDINQSPDFNKYIIYLEHFFSNVPTNREHGLLYYYLQALHLNIFYSDNPNLEFSLHKSIGDVNFYLFIIGLFGIFQLLNHFNFSKKSIGITLLFLNFFPPFIALRLVLKPEILAFAFLPWIVYFFEKFKITRKISFLIISIPLIISTITLKGNILVMVAIYLLIANFKVIKLITIKKFIILLSIFLFLFSVVSLENNTANSKNILEIQSGASLESNYDNKAPKSIIYKTNFYKLFSSPVKHNHADSFIAITLLELNGDYFDLYWDNDGTEFSNSRLEFLTFEQSNEIKPPNIDVVNKTITIYQQRATDVYFYETISLVLSIILISSLFKSIINFPRYRIYLTSVFVGMIVLLIHVITGFPNNNFDLLVGDTFKPLYYSFLLLLSVSFLICNYAEENKFKVVHLIIYCGIIVFLLGFPKKDFNNVDYSFIYKIENSIFCEIESSIYLKNTAYNNLICSYDQTNPSNDHFYNKKINHKPFNLSLMFMDILILTFITFQKVLKKFLDKFVLYKKNKIEAYK